VAALERQLRDLSVRIEHDHRNCRYESGGDSLRQHPAGSTLLSAALSALLRERIT
jgi:hypothetical protein